jgi:cytochrome P450 family 135
MNGRLHETVGLHRDPLGWLRARRAERGDVFALRLLTAGPTVVVCDAEAAAGVPESDGTWSAAGAARLGVLPMASDRSVFGADGATHRAARHRIAAQFTPEAVAERREAMAAIAAEHVARWPRGRPFRALPRMRAIADAIFVREVLGVRGAGAPPLARAVGALLWTPGNPPVTVPAPEQGIMGWLVDREYRRRRARVAELLGEEIRERRRRGEPGDGVLGAVLGAEPDATPDAVVEELLSLLMAAQEPMAAALTWLLLVLSAPEAAQARAAVAQEGVDAGLGAAAVRETLRLHPSALASLRRLTEDREIAGRRLPANTTIMVPLPLIQRDARYHDDPDAFRPDRPAPRSEHALLPFGGGPRRCLGEPLAFAEIGAVLPTVLRAAQWRCAGPQPERMVLRATILVPQRSGLVIAAR